MARRGGRRLAGGEPFKPRVRLIGDFGADAARERAARRLEAFVAGEASRRLAALKRLTEAVAEGDCKGLARGLAYRLIEQFGVLDRRRAEEHIRALSQVRAAGAEGPRRAVRRLLALPAGAADARGAAIGAVFADARRAALAPRAGCAFVSCPIRPAAGGAEPAGTARGRGDGGAVLWRWNGSTRFARQPA